MELESVIGKEMTQAEVRDMLNALHEENEQLKKDKMILEHNHLPVMERKIEKYKMNVDALTETNDLLNEKIETLSDENEQLKKQIERIDFILDDLNGAEYISRDDGIKALNKIDKVIGKR